MTVTCRTRCSKPLTAAELAAWEGDGMKSVAGHVHAAVTVGTSTLDRRVNRSEEPWSSMASTSTSSAGNTRGLTGTPSAARPAESTPMLAFRFEVQGLAPTVADDSRCHAAADRA